MHAVFLDKDGTLIENVPYNVDPERMRLLPGTATGLRRLHAAGYRLVVVSNQSGVARGYFAEAALPAVERRLRELLEGIPLAGFYYCPHHPAGTVAEYAISCDCRKPAPGLVRRAAADLGIDPAGSWLIGDLLDDVEAGWRAGCRTIWLDTTHELTAGPRPHHRAADLDAAATIILAGG